MLNKIEDGVLIGQSRNIAQRSKSIGESQVVIADSVIDSTLLQRRNSKSAHKHGASKSIPRIKQADQLFKEADILGKQWLINNLVHSKMFLQQQGSKMSSQLMSDRNTDRNLQSNCTFMEAQSPKNSAKLEDAQSLISKIDFNQIDSTERNNNTLNETAEFMTEPIKHHVNFEKLLQVSRNNGSHYVSLIQNNSSCNPSQTSSRNYLVPQNSYRHKIDMIKDILNQGLAADSQRQTIKLSKASTRQIHETHANRQSLRK